MLTNKKWNSNETWALDKSFVVRELQLHIWSIATENWKTIKKSVLFHSQSTLY